MLSKSTQQNNLQYYLAYTATCLAFVVIVVGAYTRLSHAGLSCPDWPYCYGKIMVPLDNDLQAIAQQNYPLIPLEVGKAWIEMGHRYLAGLLLVLITSLAFLSYKNKNNNFQPIVLPMLILLLVMFQAALGMWTVTLKLRPIIVMSHLMGGMTTFGLLSLLTARLHHLNQNIYQNYFSPLQKWALFSLVIIVIQIILGGWTSANYAALACPDFPNCYHAIVQTWDFNSAFNIFADGLKFNAHLDLSQVARVTIHMTHRYWAIFVVITIGILYYLLRNIRHNLKLVMYKNLLIITLGLQLILGFLNIYWQLPLSVAVMHNGGAALLLLLSILINFELFQETKI